MVRAIGWWIDSLADEEQPAPREWVGQQPAEIRTTLVRYLTGGLRLAPGTVTLAREMAFPEWLRQVREPR